MSKWKCPAKLREIQLSEACDYIKEQYGINVSAARLRSWVRVGLMSHSGRRIYLRAKKCIDWVTCKQWIDAFIKKLDDGQHTKVKREDNNVDDTEKLLSLKEAQKYIKREYQRDITLPTLRNWCTRGLVSLNGHRFILGARKRAGTYKSWWVTKEQINQFIAELDQ